MKTAVENLHLILTEELYKVDEIDKKGATNQTKPPEPSQSIELPLEKKEVTRSARSTGNYRATHGYF